MYSQRVILLIIIMISMIIGMLIIIINKRLSNKDQDMEKMTPYECGFSPYGTARKRMDIQYYLVGILFLIFDLEVSFIFPYTQIKIINMESYNILMIFLVILTIGFIYEWRIGGLEWE